jgi:carbamoyl-phosphate synthase large subunit
MPLQKSSGTNATVRDMTPARRSAGAVLLSSAGSKIPLLRALRRACNQIDPALQVIAGDSDDTVLSRYVADGFWHMPRLCELSASDLAGELAKRRIDTVLPSRDGELVFWARRSSALASAGVGVIVSPENGVQRCIDKLAFAQFGQAAGIPVIPAAASLEGLGAGPFVVKERFGAGSLEIGLDLDYRAAKAHALSLKEPIFQPFIHGMEISIDGWVAKSGEPSGVVLRRRDKVLRGESQVTTTYRDPGIERLAIEALRVLDLRGPVVMQGIVAANGEFQFLECNCRFGGASTASIAAGLDILYWSLAERYGIQKDMVFNRIPGEIRQIRVPSDIILHDPDL